MVTVGAGLGGVVAAVGPPVHAGATGSPLYAWGWAGDMQLGNGTSDTSGGGGVSTTPVGACGGVSDLTAVAAGLNAGIGLRSDGTVVGWGDNGNNLPTAYGGSPRQIAQPTPILGLSGITKIDSAEASALALHADGSVTAWGSNQFGQLGANAAVIAQPVGLNSGVTAISGGHTGLAVQNGAVLAWGYNSNGQVGDGTTVDRYQPLPVPGLTSGFVDVESGWSQTSFAIRANGTVMAWGANQYGQIGDGTTVERHTPVQIPGLTNVVQIAAGFYHTVALKADGSVVQWGANDWDSQFGNPVTYTTTPVPVTGLSSGVTKIAAGARHTLALKSDGTVVAWGNSILGKLGNGSTDGLNVFTPVAVQGLTGVTDIAAGGQQSYAVATSGTASTQCNAPLSVTHTVPTDGAVYTKNATVLADYTCASSGAAVAICDGTRPVGTTVDTSSGGQKSFSVTVADLAGHARTSTVHYRVIDDQAAPTISIVTPPTSASYPFAASVNANYSCSDEAGGSGLASCVGSVADGDPIDTSTAGPHTFSVTATDNAGHSSTATRSYTVAAPDLTDPSITITRPSIGATYSIGQAVTASYACTDEPGGSGLASCVGTVPNGNALDTSAGSHAFSVTATDNAGNTRTVSRSYDVVPILDNTPPTITSSSPADGAVYAPNQVVIAGYSCADEAGGSGLATCDGTVASGSAIDTSTPGTGVFEVTATDAAGNDTHVVRHYTVGGPGPLIAIYNPASGADYAAGEVVAATYSCTPAPGGAAVASCVGDVASGDPLNTALGFHGFSVTATDVLGRTTTETVPYHVFVLDSASATLPPEGGTVMTSDSPTPAAPFGAVVTSPNGGDVSIVDRIQGGNAPTGYTSLGAQVLITAPPASADNPLVLTFYGEGTALPPWINQSNIQLFKDGVLLPDCIGATAVPAGLNACIAGRDSAPSGGGDIRITVISVSASHWTLAAPLPTVTAGTASVVEGNSGTRVVNVPVTLSAVSDRAVSAHWSTAGATATSGVDFLAGSGTVTFLAGQRQAIIPVTVKGDTAAETDETLRIVLSSPLNSTVGGSGVGTATIVDDDRPALTVNDVSVTEGNTGAKKATFTVSLSKALTGAVTVTVSTANGTAKAPGDYTATTLVVTVKPGKTSVTVKVPVVGDRVKEPNETFFVRLSNASAGARIADASGTGTIVNND